MSTGGVCLMIGVSFNYVTAVLFWLAIGDFYVAAGAIAVVLHRGVALFAKCG
jgi:hypothetical protein